MREEERTVRQRVSQFFRLALVTDSYVNVYQTNFNMMIFYHFTLTELNEMYPYERMIYTTLLNQHIENENKRKNGQL